MDRSSENKSDKCITANTSAIWQHAAHITDQLTSPSCLTGTIHKCLSLNEKFRDTFKKRYIAERTNKADTRPE